MSTDKYKRHSKAICYCHTDAERVPWQAINYGEKATVSVEKVVLYNRKDCCYARTRNVEILLVAQIPATGEKNSLAGSFWALFTDPQPGASGL